MDDLQRDKEESERILEGVRIGTAIGELQSTLWEQDEELDGLQVRVDRTEANVTHLQGERDAGQ